MPLVTLLLLAIGSLMLLPGPVVWLAMGDTWAFVFGTVGAVFLFLGWAKLGVDISDVRRDTGAYPSLRKGSMLLAYGISWTAFVVGTVSLSGLTSMPPPPPVTRELLPELLLYVPSIYAPVVLGQASILLLGTDYLARPRGRLMSLIGISTLFVIALIAIAVELRGAPAPWALFLAGITSLGYMLVAVPWLLYPAQYTPTDRSAGIDRSADAGYALPGSAGWGKWARRRNGWAALIPGILLLIVSYLLSTFLVCASGVGCTRPFVAEGLGALGVGLFLIILGLVLYASS
ncbi:MAG: hypothetical protein ACE5I4_08815 [Thermoplasmata archaeon]